MNASWDTHTHTHEHTHARIGATGSDWHASTHAHKHTCAESEPTSSLSKRATIHPTSSSSSAACGQTPSTLRSTRGEQADTEHPPINARRAGGHRAPSDQRAEIILPFCNFGAGALIFHSKL
eukprot:7231138-Pyramimonas_sp.AAC.1